MFSDDGSFLDTYGGNNMSILNWNDYLEKAAQVNAEGAVLVRNENALPLDKNDEIAVFGRIQLHYYKSGTGSGGMVNVTKVTGIIEGLTEEGAKLNKELLKVYTDWVEEHPYEYGEGWGGEPWSQEEMPLSDEIAAKAAETSKAAVVVIGRTAGEEQDNSCKAGSYLLSDGEKQMLRTVRQHFKKMIVVLNVGNIIDMSFVDEFEPESVMYVWQGGMTGGTGTARILLGEVSPSGRMPDTVAYNISDYPSDKYFGDRDRNFYKEDIFVGYRYFETFAPEKVRYPFGFGLSYTTFESRLASASKDKTLYKIKVTNTGSRPGKETVQLYCDYADAPKGSLSTPKRVLCGFAKTPVLAAGESCTVEIPLRYKDIAVYDDSGVTGHKSCWVLPADRRYVIGIGKNAADVTPITEFKFDEDVIVEYCIQALAPVMPFERMINDGGKIGYEPVPMLEVSEDERRKSELPEEIAFTGDKGIRFTDVAEGRNTLEEFVAQLTDKELDCLIHGEGMCSPKVTPGTAAAFGGVSERLKALGVPCGCCSDGPSGMRLDVGTKAFSLPNGTLIAATFNRELITELFEFMGAEMRANKVDCLLGPGMNIHRHPLNGRNFEYFSEDPYLTGMMAAAELHGLHSQGVEGTVKHFCANNQETNRHFLDAAVSERALREIYLRGFEIAIRDGKGRSVMTTYGKVNDLWTAGSYDLNTVILRDEWGFDGFAMTDWWANINVRGKAPDKSDLAAMVKAQNDVYMVCADGENHPDNVISSIENGTLTRGELQRSACNVLSFLLSTHAMKRVLGTDEKVEIINKPEDTVDAEASTRVYKVNGDLTIDLSDVKTAMNKDHSFTLDVAAPGMYSLTLTASSEQSELAQMPVTLFSTGSVWGTFTWNGTGGKPVSFSSDNVPLFSRYTVIRLHFGLGGLDLISLTLKKH